MQRDDFNYIYYEYSDKIYRYIFLLIRNKELAEDLTQDTFYKAYKNLNTFKREASIYTWLLKIARNVTYDFLRKKSLLSIFSSKKVTVPNVATPQEIIIKDEEVKILYDSINKLKLEYQEVIVLRKIKEFSIKETAEVLGWRESKVKTTTTRAMVALKKELLKEVKVNGNIFEIG